MGWRVRAFFWLSIVSRVLGAPQNSEDFFRAGSKLFRDKGFFSRRPFLGFKLFQGPLFGPPVRSPGVFTPLEVLFFPGVPTGGIYFPGLKGGEGAFFRKKCSALLGGDTPPGV